MHLATVPVIDDILRDGARRALQSAIEREVDDYVERNRQQVDPAGHRLVVRNGHHPARKIQSGNGPIEVHQPRVNDKRVDEQGQRIRFTSKILPPYLRKTKAIEELVPWLYLKGISTSDFPEALGCLGHDGSGLSPTSIVRMKEVWQGEYENFCRRSLEGKRYVYLWADGIYFNMANRCRARRCCTRSGWRRRRKRPSRRWGSSRPRIRPNSPRRWNAC
jgi:transposase-like protein